ncbi:arsenate-mycothiol transferase ArsC [Amorphus orientalis]|uniref:Protein-tyrosine-phosphatase n=1 Tax=Amorphus orientalis TaxID=649198 RepID=A0AAE3VRE7_9HYPH|nr:low molecular weight phosphatase family protein [Amorphus orientalis]MDQ0316771.1 protein-tyrosine-phosphatase [Amorphus orientalis]
MSGAAARPGAVLFVCRQNAVRSPMAAELARHYFPKSLYVRSAGVVDDGEPDPFAVAVMDELGLDISKHHPRSLEELADTSFDLVVTLAPEAHHRALEMARTQAFDVEYWPTPDPTVTTGSRSQILDAYRSVRDGLANRIKTRFAP